MDKMKSKEQQKIFKTLSGKFFGKTLAHDINANKEGFHSMNENVSLWRNSMNKTLPERELVYDALR